VEGLCVSLVTAATNFDTRTRTASFRAKAANAQWNPKSQQVPVQSLTCCQKALQAAVAVQLQIGDRAHHLASERFDIVKIYKTFDQQIYILPN